MYMCIRGIDFAAVSMLVWLDFRTVLRVLYFTFFMSFYYPFFFTGWREISQARVLGRHDSESIHLLWYTVRREIFL